MKANVYEILILEIVDFVKIFSIFDEIDECCFQLSKNEKDFLFLPEKDSDDLETRFSVFIKNQALKNALSFDLERVLNDIDENQFFDFLRDYSKDIYFIRQNSENKIEYFYLEIDTFWFLRNS